jgi:hypothetical protein
MLLHEHPANLAREAMGEVAVNSIWLSGGGVMPQNASLNDDVDLMMAHSIFYQGLALWADVSFQALPVNLDSVLQNSVQHTHVRLQMPQIDDLDQFWFNPLLAALKHKKIEQLTLNLGFYDTCLTAEIKPLNTYQFWRKLKPVMHYLS